MAKNKTEIHVTTVFDGELDATEVNWKIKFQSIHPKNWNLVLQNIS